MMSVSYAATATVITETLRLRKGPTTDSNILRNLDEGDKLNVIGKEGDWYKISFDGYVGYILDKYVEIDGEVPNIDQEEENNSNKNEENGENEEKPTIDKTESGDITLKANTSLYILPALISSPLKTVEKETAIKFIETINNWSNIDVDGTKGWVLNKDINNFNEIQEAQEVNASLNKEEKSTKTGYINVSSANVRSEASMDGKVIKTLVLNNEVKIIEKTGDWYKIENGDGEAYIYANLVSSEKTEVTSRSSSTSRANPISEEKSASLIESANGNAVAEYAKQYIGYNYVYGGSGPTSFDCSGFTMFIFKKFGISLPHNAVTQSNYGVYVSKENLVPGDLVIFNDYSNTSIGHSAIYIGNGKIVHAANSSRGVTTDTILSGYYNIRFVEGRRLI